MEKVRTFFSIKKIFLLLFLITIGTTTLFAAGYLTEEDGSSDTVYVDDQGNVGIGTTNPVPGLHILRKDSMPHLTLERVGGRYNPAASYSVGVGRIGFLVYDNIGGTERFVISRNGNVSIPSNSLTIATRDKAQLVLQSNVDHENYSLGVSAGSFLINSRDRINNSDTNRFAIDPNGNVGIGTTSPESTLHIRAQDATALLTLEQTSSEMYGSRGRYSFNISYDALQIRDQRSRTALEIYNGKVKIPSGSLTIETPDTGTASTNQLTLKKIDSNGNSSYSIGATGGPMGGTFTIYDNTYREPGLEMNYGNVSIPSGNLGVTGNITSSGAITASGNIRSSGTIIASGDIRSSGKIIAASYGTIAASGNISSTGAITANGDIASSGTITAATYACTSDLRYKKNIIPIQGALTKVLSLNGVTYDWKQDQFKEKHFTADKQIGFIAQDVERIIPEVVHTAKDGYKAISYNKITTVLVEAIKEMKKKNDELRERVASLERVHERIARLEWKGKR